MGKTHPLKPLKLDINNIINSLLKSKGFLDSTSIWILDFDASAGKYNQVPQTKLIAKENIIRRYNNSHVYVILLMAQKACLIRTQKVCAHRLFSKLLIQPESRKQKAFSWERSFTSISVKITKNFLSYIWTIYWKQRKLPLPNHRPTDLTCDHSKKLKLCNIYC